MLDALPPVLFIFISAELLLVLARARDIKLLAKRESQRAKLEQKQVDRGLLPSLLLEFILFVPASATLVLLVVAPFITTIPTDPEYTFYALLGVASYGFPFLTIKKVVVRIALNTLKDFAEITQNDTREDKD